MTTTIARQRFKQLLAQPDLERLFNELGWDRPQKTDLALRVGVSSP